LHPQVAIALLDRFNASLSVPIALLEAGTTSGAAFGAYGSPAVGDPRLGLRVRLFGHAERDAISVHAGGQVYLGFLGIAPSAANVSDGTVRGRAYVTVAGRAGSFVWSLLGGYHGRPTLDTAAQAVVSNEIYATAAVALVTARDRLTIGPEFWVASSLQRFGGTRQTGAEALLGANYQLTELFSVGAGLGMGLNQQLGTPQVRALLRLAYAPVTRREAASGEPSNQAPSDFDHDGVLDADDACVREPAGAHPDPARRGCPLRDTDGDAVFDPEDVCVSEPGGERPDAARRGCPTPDSDRDTVLDPDDVCVSEPRGEHPDPARAGCPAGDRDGDTVFDPDDQCVDVSAGLNPDEARRGCPLPDRDHDAVVDARDRCPGLAGAPRSNPRRNGCPGMVVVDGGRLRLTQPVYFRTNRDIIRPRSFRVLRAVGEVLRETPAIRRLTIDGHTDNAGDDAHNLDLSQRRTQSVMRWLVAYGIDAARLEAHGYGETRPIAPNTTRRGRATNRRVEFVVLDPRP